MTSVVIIGAGIGGLAAAARLARSGFQVTLFEKNGYPGGRTGFLEQDGYRFDTGPTLFLMPDVFAETFRSLGTKMEDHLDLVRLDPTYRVHFQDDTILDLSSDLNLMHAQLEAMEPGSFAQFLKFIAEGYLHYQLSLKHFVGRNFSSIFDYFSPGNLPLLFRLKALVKHQSNTSRYFHDPRLRAAFSFQNMYLGVSPYEAPATYSLLQYTEMANGVWFPRGGMYRVIQSLASLAEENGARLIYHTPAACINVDAGRASGITLESGETFPADIVIANADLPYVYDSLLPQDGNARRLAHKKYTSSALMYYWGVKGPPSQELLHHNVFLADHQYRASFDRIFHDNTLPDEPSFYVNAVTRTDPSFAPADGDALMVLVPVGHIDPSKNQNWEALSDRAKEAVLIKLARLGIIGLQERLVFEARWRPPDYEKELNLAKGAAFGLSHNFTQVGYLRPHNRHAIYKNLYFTGASTHPGTGLPIVLLSARLTVERILQDAPTEIRQNFLVR